MYNEKLIFILFFYLTVALRARINVFLYIIDALCAEEKRHLWLWNWTRNVIHASVRFESFSLLSCCTLRSRHRSMWKLKSPNENDWRSKDWKHLPGLLKLKTVQRETSFALVTFSALISLLLPRWKQRLTSIFLSSFCLPRLFSHSPDAVLRTEEEAVTNFNWQNGC